MADLDFDRLFHGISTQPGWRKRPGQVTDALNCFLELGIGAPTRNATDHVRNLESGDPLLPILQPGQLYRVAQLGTDTIFIGRNAGGVLRLFAQDKDGVSLAINDPGGIGFAYLEAGGNLFSNIRTSERADTVIITNRTVVTEVEAAPAGVVTGTVADYYALPGAPLINQIYKVNADKDIFPRGHYQATALGPPVVWTRVAEPGQAGARPKASTLPHRLIRDGVGGFNWQRIPWVDRLTGDSLTNPAPSWIGRPIQATAIHQQRGFYGDERVIWSSRAREFFNLFTDNVFAVVDSDPIKRDLDYNSGALLWMIPVEGSLFLAFERLQAEYTSYLEPLTNVNGKPRVLSEFPLLDIRPVVGTPLMGEGILLYCIDETKQVQRFQLNTVLGALAYSDAAAAHCHIGWITNYQPRGLAFAHGVLYVLTDTDLLHHRFSIVGQRVEQAAWGRFTMPGVVRHLFQVGDEVRLYSEFEDRYFCLTKMKAVRGPTTGVAGQESEGLLEVDPRLDHRELLEGTYDPLLDETRFDVKTPGDAELSRLALMAGGTVGAEVTPRWTSFLAVAFPGRLDVPVTTHLADGGTLEFTYDFPVLNTTELTFTHNGAALDLLVWAVTFPEDGVARIAKIADGSALPADDGLVISRTRKDKHYVGRRFNQQLIFERMYPGGDRRAPIMRTFKTYHVDSTDYRAVVTMPGRGDTVSRWETEIFGAVDLDDDVKRTKTGEWLHAMAGDARSMRLALIHDTVGQAIFSRLLIMVELGGF